MFTLGVLVLCSAAATAPTGEAGQQTFTSRRRRSALVAAAEKFDVAVQGNPRT